MDLAVVLESVGMSDKEAKVYLLLLEYEDSLASTIARKAGIKRSTVYMVLDSLRKKGYVTLYVKAGVQYFKALEPELILEDIDVKYRILKESIPDLKKLNKMFHVRPSVQIFEGKEGLIRLMEDTLTTENKELLVWSDINLAWYGPIESYFPEYVKKRVEKKIWVKGIFTDSEQARGFKQRSKSELRKVNLIDPEKFPFKNEINIYNNKVNIISFKDEMGVLIENEDIANTQKSIFELAWEYTELLNSLKK
jgi:sugar-specific transcriptional regulator TrmB